MLRIAGIAFVAGVIPTVSGLTLRRQEGVNDLIGKYNEGVTEISPAKPTPIDKDPEFGAKKATWEKRVKGPTHEEPAPSAPSTKKTEKVNALKARFESPSAPALPPKVPVYQFEHATDFAARKKAFADKKEADPAPKKRQPPVKPLDPEMLKQYGGF
uniref:Uncharacterized protein n=1 Tax=Chromera velia CCMP2878 TaxID=1169474 RepID=A0A0G4F1P5_9ALVE|eukprot:Cvel_14683.t1-p1 / transcript=Cvel_14683.t1 / gene=Cvel_14683 / organism=Chromera_velia_CCMP2878 / gene_product=hypothetical protein / transcript_product=hypothetical protein / location=Cvel_scaffold1053:38674-40080(+) / protein_length=156 / sequence_SO=supercontig / SO=protein_coding / is_pseudo=false